MKCLKMHDKSWVVDVVVQPKDKLVCPVLTHILKHNRDSIVTECQVHLSKMWMGRKIGLCVNLVRVLRRAWQFSSLHFAE